MNALTPGRRTASAWTLAVLLVVGGFASACGGDTPTAGLIDGDTDPAGPDGPGSMGA